VTREFIERIGRIEDLDRSFNLDFWLAQPSQVRFQVAWERVLHTWQVKGNDVRQLRLHRSVENFNNNHIR
jgi:hypothetical protein